MNITLGRTYLLGLVHMYLVVVVPAQVGQEAAYRAPCVHLSDNDKCSNSCSSGGWDCEAIAPD